MRGTRLIKRTSEKKIPEGSLVRLKSHCVPANELGIIVGEPTFHCPHNGEHPGFYVYECMLVSDLSQTRIISSESMEVLSNLMK